MLLLAFENIRDRG